MIVATLFAAVLRVLGPTVAEAHEAAVAELVDPADAERCELALELQPHDCPERARWALAAIADRESPGSLADGLRWVGRHRTDSRHEGGLWRAGHRRGRQGRRTASFAWWCPAHADPVGMSTVGPHGLIYTFNVHRLHAPGNCVPWWIFASPRVSAVAALDRYLELCGEPHRSGWCPSTAAIVAARRRRIARTNR